MIRLAAITTNRRVRPKTARCRAPRLVEAKLLATASASAGKRSLLFDRHERKARMCGAAVDAIAVASTKPDRITATLGA